MDLLKYIIIKKEKIMNNKSDTLCKDCQNCSIDDQIVLPDGTVVGHWDGVKIETLQTEIQRIQSNQKSNSDPRSNYVTKFGVPYKHQVPEHLREFIAYIIWGVDLQGNALVASRANRLEHIDYISEWAGNSIAMDAKNRAVDPKSGCK